MKKRITWAILGVAAVVITVPGVFLWDYHKEPAFCGTFCHIMKPYVASWEASDFLAKAHADEEVICLDCHEPTIKQQVEEAMLFVSGKYQDPLVMRQFPDDFCLKCHEHGSRDQIIERTQDYTVGGQEINPHNPHEGVDETLVSEIECWNCHKMHQKSATINYCYECHHDYTFQGCDGADCH